MILPLQTELRGRCAKRESTTSRAAAHMIVGNINVLCDRIFHVIGQQFEGPTDPAACFSNEAATIANGCRTSLR